MKIEFIPYEQALALKELGFDEECLLTVSHSGDCDYRTKEPFKSYAWLNGEQITFNYEYPEYGDKYENINIPLYQQAFRWFIEKYDLYYHIATSNKGYVISVKGIAIESFEWNKFKTYEEAELECLKKLIEIVKSK